MGVEPSAKNPAISAARTEGRDAPQPALAVELLGGAGIICKYPYSSVGCSTMFCPDA